MRSEPAEERYSAYDAALESKGSFMVMTVMKRWWCWEMRSFAISTAAIRWPIPGEGMKINSAFFIFWQLRKLKMNEEDDSFRCHFWVNDQLVRKWQCKLNWQALGKFRWNANIGNDVTALLAISYVLDSPICHESEYTLQLPFLFLFFFISFGSEQIMCYRGNPRSGNPIVY